jgi:hypothetical protein
MVQNVAVVVPVPPPLAVVPLVLMVAVEPVPVQKIVDPVARLLAPLLSIVIQEQDMNAS